MQAMWRSIFRLFSKERAKENLLRISPMNSGIVYTSVRAAELTGRKEVANRTTKDP